MIQQQDSELSCAYIKKANILNIDRFLNPVRRVIVSIHATPRLDQAESVLR